MLAEPIIKKYIYIKKKKKKKGRKAEPRKPEPFIYNTNDVNIICNSLK